MKFRYLLLLGFIGSWGCGPTPAELDPKPKSEGKPSSKAEDSKGAGKPESTDKLFKVDLENPDSRPEGDSTLSPEFQVTHLVATDTEYYLDGPQQMRAPDGQLPEGTKVQLVQDSGSYSVVVSENGIRAYVSTASLKPAKVP